MNSEYVISTMQIISNFHKDVQTQKPQPGGYEWWYFDAMDHTGRYKLVVIFYEGNPFSPSYISEQQATADQYPAISISVYDGNDPIYYSFTEYNPEDCAFSSENPSVKVGSHTMKGYKKEGHIIYELKLEETLPSGDFLKADMRFHSKDYNDALLPSQNMSEQGHLWNLVQPYAEVTGSLYIESPITKPVSVEFEGTGYHDHNTGHEPMKEEFRDWYWGRFHFQDYTLIYYLMNREETEQYRAWLIGHKKGNIIESFEHAEQADKSLSLFGMKSARKISLKNERFEITIQQSRVLDSGPFYQRFESEAFLYEVESGKVESATGLSEYIYPGRIYRRVFWPLVKMRVYNKQQGPHWVQKLPRLYRWTW